MKVRNILVAAVVAAAGARVASADTVTITSAPIQGIAGASGLNGALYHDDSNSIDNNGDHYSDVMALINSKGAPDATYTVHSLTYTGTDTTPTNVFLGADSNGSAALDTAGIHTTVFNATGYIDVTKAGTYTFTSKSDDGSYVEIGTGADRVDLVSNGGTHSADDGHGSPGTATFSETGFYAIQILYFNQDRDGTGGADLSFLATDPDNLGVNFYETVTPGQDLNTNSTTAPEPASLGLLGLASLGLLSRRRKA